MGAYNSHYSLREETELVCREMIGEIKKNIMDGDITYQEFISDPSIYMDHKITYGDRWYHRIIISRLKKIFEIDESEIEKEIRMDEERVHRNTPAIQIIEEPIPF